MPTPCMTTFYDHLARNGPIVGISRVPNVLPISFSQLRRIIEKGKQDGLFTVRRLPGQGRPMLVDLSERSKNG